MEKAATDPDYHEWLDLDRLAQGYTPDQIERVIEFLIRLPLAELRQRQAIHKEQIKLDMTSDAVSRQVFGVPFPGRHSAQTALAALIKQGLTFRQCRAAFAPAKAKGPYARAMVAPAKEEHEGGGVEIDDHAIISGAGDDGAYVLAWAWVADPRRDGGQPWEEYPKGTPVLFFDRKNCNILTRSTIEALSEDDVFRFADTPDEPFRTLDLHVEYDGAVFICSTEDSLDTFTR